MDQLKAMEIFVEVARQRSFTVAGQRLGLTRAMVSKTIMQLEERLDARLLHRSTREVSLTDAGRAYLAPCMATVSQAQEAARMVAHVAQAGAGLAHSTARQGASGRMASALLSGMPPTRIVRSKPWRIGSSRASSTNNSACTSRCSKLNRATASASQALPKLDGAWMRSGPASSAPAPVCATCATMRAASCAWLTVAMHGAR